jgi:hypothetical protein
LIFGIDFLRNQVTMEAMVVAAGGPSTRGCQVFGPLPVLYRFTVILCTLLVGIGSGAWIAHDTALPVAVSGGALLGGLAGLLASVVLVHDFSTQARPARAVRRR